MAEFNAPQRRLRDQRLTVSTTGDRTIDYQVTFELIDRGKKSGE